MHTEASIQTKAKQAAKDSVFRDLFGNPKYLFQLYQALHPEDINTTEDEIGTVTIKNVLLNQMYNDLGFTVGKENLRLMILLEAQSTWTINILVRILMYLANTLQEYIESRKLNVYASKQIELPMPELYVIYTGERKDCPEWISLADAFFAGNSPFVDVRVKVLRDGKKGDIINQYVTFTKVYQDQVSRCGRTRQAVLETIRICKNENVLKEYLENREKEVVDIMMTLFDQEYAVERYGDEREAEGLIQGRAEGRAEGLSEGVLKQAKETALSMKEEGFSINMIVKVLKVSPDIIHQWLSDETEVPLC